MDTFYKGFEANICLQFKIWPIEQKGEVIDILRKETEAKQAKLEAEALAVLEAKLKEEERIKAEEAAKTGKTPAKAAPPAKKAPAKDDKPVLDVPKIPMK